MRSVIIRTLRREFHLLDQAGDSPLRFVEARAEIAGAAPAPTVIALEPMHGFFKARLPAGPLIEGTLRNLARALDLFTLSRAEGDEPDAVILPAALLVSSAGRRVAFVGSRRSGRTSLAIALMSTGWAFEGDERLFVRSDGVVSHPRTLRLTRSLVRCQPQFAGLVDAAPSIELLRGEVVFALDPQRLAPDWRVRAGPLDGVVFLDGTMARLSSLRRITLEEAFGRALALCTFASGVRAHRIGLLRAALARAALFHLQPGELPATLATVIGIPGLAAA